jgi:methionine synthase I (cobalamin-dependent)/5,10-methylenetetrahydrofolate reductase
MKSFKDILADGTPLLFDGAIGTELYNRGIFINRCFDEANLTNPSLITQLHQDYLKAGAQVITTNSWGANRFKLKHHNLQDRVTEINRKAAELAREVASDQAYVSGSVGPLGVRIEPWGPTSFAEAKEAFGEQIAALVAGGIDVLCFETFADLSELKQAIDAAHETAPQIPIIAHVVIDMEAKLPAGSPVEWAMHELEKWRVDAVGLNCSVGPGPMLSAIEKIRKGTKKPICVQPNAGLPKVVEGRTIYMCSPEYMGEFAKNFLAAGVQFVGGCCGTSPEHIKSMANAIRHRSAMVDNERMISQGSQVSIQSLSSDAPAVTRVPFAEKSNWSRKIAAGEMVYAVELLPPTSVIPDSIIEKSRQLKSAGVDVVNIPDGPRASARMSAILTAVLIERDAGIETVLHYTCRDRNLLGMQSDMLGAHAIGLRNLLLVTGDPPKIGSYPNATGVFDIDAIGLTNMVHRLNGGLDLGGRSIGQPTSISVGVGANPVHQNIDYELKRFKYKVEAGAEWAITQPVFDVDALFRFLDFIDRNQIRVPIIAGIWPLVSHRNAVFMNNEVPGVVIPAEIIKRMERPKNPEDAKKVGVEIAIEMIEQLGKNIQGVQVSAPFGRIDLALQVIGK